MLFLILAWRTCLLRVRDIFLSSSTRSTGFGSICHEPCPTTNFFFSFRWREEGATSVFRVPANHLASTFFLPVSGDPREVTEYKHLFLTVILWWLATVNSNKRIVVIIFLSSQWDTTWQYWQYIHLIIMEISDNITSTTTNVNKLTKVKMKEISVKNE